MQIAAIGWLPKVVAEMNKLRSNINQLAIFA